MTLLIPAIPAGVILDFAGTSAPPSWLFCYGQAVSRTGYPALFSAIGTTFGTGDGSTTFNLPDCRGRVVAGKDDMGGSSANRLTGLSGGVDGDGLGNTGGSEAHTLTESQMPSHTHTYLYRGGSGGLPQHGGAATQADVSTASGSTGGNGAHNNVQPTLILNKIIKY